MSTELKSFKSQVKAFMKTFDKFKSSYDAGFDAGLNGSNSINTDFRWFNTKENMQEWERGKKNAIEKNY